ncbi:manganese transport protein MntH [Fimicolochytrium jonesii]|uniref:manganese transport protein MntH n=1 Tax=Fimicolochytrium jonesii TaxID=1396493 RepID=UPI0022FEBBF8|nr:manganese transport protein MntH [Fimicolochytrium jonesii]KAI8818249.1 manganese transport protein MntH [Fimicolochytrium jonesii]
MIHGPGLPSPFVASLGGAPETPWYRTLLRFIGPGSMIAVGYMDPGNWATDLSGGSQFYYNPLFAILFASTVAMLLQSLAVKAGLVTGKDLAELCRHSFNPWANFFLYLTAEAAIIATDLAEVIGAAIALNLLFKCPLPWAVAITGLDVLIILFGFGPKYLRWFEFGIMALVGIIGVCFVALLIKVGPNWGDVFEGYIPHRELFTNGDQLWIFMGIVGATIMPHNLFLHTHLIQYRYSQTAPATLLPTGTIVPEAFEKADAPLARHHMKLLPKTIKYTTIDCILSLTYALFINSAILIVAGAAFYTTGNTQIATLHDAYDLLGKLLSPAFAVIFGIALLASGQSSTITGTIAGQVVMSGFLGSRFRVKPWVRRLVSRGLALIPALVVVLVKGSNGLDELLVVSQVILSVQLPFSIWPLIWFTSRKGEGSSWIYSIRLDTTY